MIPFGLYIDHKGETFMNNATRDPELKLLTSYKSYTGIIGYVCILGFILAVIGVVCPFCSYNPTILDITKRTVQFWDLSFIYIALSTVLILISFFLFEITKYFTNWRSRKKLFIIFTALSCVFILLAYIFITIACVFYKIPETAFSMLETDFEVGFYLFTIGLFVFAVAFIFYSILIIKVIDGKTDIENLVFIKKENA